VVDRQPIHELRTGALLRELLPEVALTCRSAKSDAARISPRVVMCIDASLKPVMSAYLHALQRRLKESNLAGRVRVTSKAAYRTSRRWRSADPVAQFGAVDGAGCRTSHARHAGGSTAIVTDAGGTTFV